MNPAQPTPTQWSALPLRIWWPGISCRSPSPRIDQVQQKAIGNAQNRGLERLTYGFLDSLAKQKAKL